MEKKNVDCLPKISVHPEEKGFPPKHSSKVWEHRPKTDVHCGNAGEDRALIKHKQYSLITRNGRAKHEHNHQFPLKSSVRLCMTPSI